MSKTIELKSDDPLHRQCLAHLCRIAQVAGDVRLAEYRKLKDEWARERERQREEGPK